MNWMVVSGTAHPALSAAIVEALGVKPGRVHIRRFPAGKYLFDMA